MVELQSYHISICFINGESFLSRSTNCVSEEFRSRVDLQTTEPLFATVYEKHTQPGGRFQ